MSNETKLVSVQDFVLDRYDAEFLSYIQKLTPDVLTSKLPENEMEIFITAVREPYMQKEILAFVRDAVCDLKGPAR